MSPIDYTINVKNPFESAVQGLKTGLGIRQAEQQQAQQQQQHQVIQSLLSKPNASAAEWSNAMLLVPQLKDQFKQAWEVRSQAQQQAALNDLSRWGAAVNNGQSQLAVDEITARADALEASAGGPTQESQALRTNAQIIQQNPNFARFMMNASLAAHPEGGKVIESLNKIGQEQRAQEIAPFEKQIKQSEAGVAEEKAILGLEKTAEDIRASKENSRIKAMEAALGRETNELKRQELQIKIDEAKQARDTKVRERDAEAESAVTGVDNTISLLRGILGDEDTLRAAVGSSAWRGALPGTKARTMAGKIEQLKNVTASINLDKLKGAMSDKDIEFLKNIETNLDRYQNEDQFIGELNRVFGNLVNARERIVKKYGVSGTPLAEGETVITGHPKYGDVSMRRAQLLAQKAGMSVEEVMQFLREGGGK